MLPDLMRRLFLTVVVCLALASPVSAQLVSTSLAADAATGNTGTTTTFVLTSGTGIQSSFFMLIDQEVVVVTAVSGANVTARRAVGGFNGPHKAGAQVYAGLQNYFFPSDPQSPSCIPGSSPNPFMNQITGQAWICSATGMWQSLNAAPTPGPAGAVITSQGPGLPPAYSSLFAVSSIAGTANQITASAPTGAVTLSLPQPINFGTTTGDNFYLLSTYTGATGASTANLAIGPTTFPLASTSYKSIAIGQGALAALTSGITNICIGVSACPVTTTGSNNTAVGEGSLGHNIDGSFNIAIGEGTMDFNTSGQFNVGAGFSALFNNTTGNGNNGYGYQAIDNNLKGDRNNGFGMNALLNTNGIPPLGSYNTGVGHEAGYVNVSGNYNLYLGYGADTTVNNLTNSTALGHAASITASNQMVFGDGNVTANVMHGTVTGGTFNPTAAYQVNGKLAVSVSAPTATTFCTSPSIPANNGTAAFTVNVGTACATSTATITLPAATTGWVVDCHNVTAPATNLVEQTGGTTTTATLTNYVRTTGVAGNWTDSNILRCTAMAY